MPQETATALREGWLYTGDLGKMDKDGYFYFVDRKKDMINAKDTASTQRTRNNSRRNQQ